MGRGIPDSNTAARPPFNSLPVSVKVMSMVFEHYPEGGGEMLLALALADFSDDDGGKVFPSITSLAKKTRQSERSVQYQLRRMEKSVLSRLQKSVRVVASGEENTSPPNTKSILNSSLKVQKKPLLAAMKVVIRKMHLPTFIVRVQILHR